MFTVLGITGQDRKKATHALSNTLNLAAQKPMNRSAKFQTPPNAVDLL